MRFWLHVCSSCLLLLLWSREEECVPWSVSSEGWSQECCQPDAGGGNPATHSSRLSLCHFYPYWGREIRQTVWNGTDLESRENKLSVHMLCYFSVIITFVLLASFTSTSAFCCSRMLYLSTLCHNWITISWQHCFVLPMWHLLELTKESSL